jgi:hypothetical protein
MKNCFVCYDQLHYQKCVHCHNRYFVQKSKLHSFLLKTSVLDGQQGDQDQYNNKSEMEVNNVPDSLQSNEDRVLNFKCV